MAVALILFGVLFTGLLVRGIIKREMPSKFGTATLAREPIRFYVNVAMMGLFAVVSFATAAQLCLPK